MNDVDENDIRLKTERQYLPYEKTMKLPSKTKFNGAGYNTRLEEAHGELVGNDPKFWEATRTNDPGIQNANLVEVKKRRKREATIHPTGITLYHE